MQASPLVTHVKDLSDPVAAEIFRSIDMLHGLLLKLGYPTRAYTASSVQILLGLSTARQLEIQDSLSKTINIIKAVTQDIEITDKSSDVKLMQKAISHFNFKLKNYTWENTAENLVIELYNRDSVQLFRSLNFFNTCGYSLLDLCVHEWFILWERPRKVMEQVHSIVNNVLTGDSHDSYQMNVPRHIIRETYDDGTTQPFLPRSMLVEFKEMIPAYSPQGTIAGFVVTSTCKVLSIGDEAMKLDFI